MSDVEHDHDEQPSEGFYNIQQPCWRFSAWDMAGVGISLLGAVVGGGMQYIGSSIHQASGMIAREFAAAANYQRQTFDLEEAHRLNEAARAQMDQSLRELTMLDAAPEDGS